MGQPTQVSCSSPVLLLAFPVCVCVCVCMWWGRRAGIEREVQPEPLHPRVAESGTRPLPSPFSALKSVLGAEPQEAVLQKWEWLGTCNQSLTKVLTIPAAGWARVMTVVLQGKSTNQKV